MHVFKQDHEGGVITILLLNSHLAYDYMFCCLSPLPN